MYRTFYGDIAAGFVSSGDAAKSCGLAPVGLQTGTGVVCENSERKRMTYITGMRSQITYWRTRLVGNLVGKRLPDDAVPSWPKFDVQCVFDDLYVPAHANRGRWR